MSANAAEFLHTQARPVPSTAPLQTQLAPVHLPAARTPLRRAAIQQSVLRERSSTIPSPMCRPQVSLFGASADIIACPGSLRTTVLSFLSATHRLAAVVLLKPVAHPLGVRVSRPRATILRFVGIRRTSRSARTMRHPCFPHRALHWPPRARRRLILRS